VHPALRVPLLARELLCKRGRTQRMAVGRLIPSERLTSFDSATAMVAHLRSTVANLGEGLKVTGARIPGQSRR